MVSPQKVPHQLKFAGRGHFKDLLIPIDTHKEEDDLAFCAVEEEARTEILAKKPSSIQNAAASSTAKIPMANLDDEYMKRKRAERLRNLVISN